MTSLSDPPNADGTPPTPTTPEPTRKAVIVAVVVGVCGMIATAYLLS
jgi:hypothetical protein